MKEQYSMYGKKFSLEGKVAVVTGAGRGLGKVMALALAEAGADIVATARSKNEIEETQKEVIALGRRAIAIVVDVTKTIDVDKMVAKTIEHFGKIDILINNAGGGGGSTVLNLTDDLIHLDINRNLVSTVICSRAAGQHMIKQKSGKIINISSTAGQIAADGLSIYGASKAGIAHFTKSLAKEWARYNINVNCIAPGFFYTESNIKQLKLNDPKISDIILKKIPLRRFAQPEEIGTLAVFLASEASSFMTGTIVNIDGGQSIL